MKKIKIHDQVIDKVIKMSGLALSDEEKKARLKDLAIMVNWVKKLQEIDTKGVEPLTTLSYEVNKLRPDIPGEPMSQEEALEHAPHANKPYFCVPSVKA